MTIDEIISDCRQAKRTFLGLTATLSRIQSELNRMEQDLALKQKAVAANGKLCRALAYFYTPTDEERQNFMEHCEQISAAGGCPPNEELHWATTAIRHWERLNE